MILTIDLLFSVPPSKSFAYIREFGPFGRIWIPTRVYQLYEVLTSVVWQLGPIAMDQYYVIVTNGILIKWNSTGQYLTS